ncbi:MAG: hypothetical protein AAF630_15765 [Cyanobacteria bacterium P01_C01_bin.38]
MKGSTCRDLLLGFRKRIPNYVSAHVSVVACPIKIDGFLPQPDWGCKPQSNSESHINMTEKNPIKINGTNQ